MMTKEQIREVRAEIRNSKNEYKFDRPCTAKEDFLAMSKLQAKAYIRGILTENGQRLRLDLAGGADLRSSSECVAHNQQIINRFAFLGIYQRYRVVFLETHKGLPMLHLINILGEASLFEYGGDTTSEIIYKILDITLK